MSDVAKVRVLHAHVDRFYIRDKTLEAAQRAMGVLLSSDDGPNEEATKHYLAVVRRYFDGFEREARAHLRDVERRLNKINQVQYNLTAERGVAARRVEATRGVLGELAELSPQ